MALKQFKRRNSDSLFKAPGHTWICQFWRTIALFSPVKAPQKVCKQKIVKIDVLCTKKGTDLKKVHYCRWWQWWHLWAMHLIIGKACVGLFALFSVFPAHFTIVPNFQLVPGTGLGHFFRLCCCSPRSSWSQTEPLDPARWPTFLLSFWILPNVEGIPKTR